ncbi:MAG: hypothetical protein Q9182_006966 [Xanthomendoza sp. 2 TL-2023]
MSRFFLRSKSFTLSGPRPNNLSPISLSRPNPPRRTESSSTVPAASALPAAGLAIDFSSLALTSIRAQWTQGLTQYKDFHLHAALTTFKRLIRALRSPTEENPSPTTEDYSSIGSNPYHTLLPEEVALLYINIALIHAYLGSYYLAAAAFEEALLLDDVSGIAWFGLGIARSYLGELRASKRAFTKCLACFATHDSKGERYDQDEIIYNVWPGHPTAHNEAGSVGVDEGFKGVGSDLQVYKDILVSRIPDGQWKLERLRVEWNWRTVMFERNWVRKGVPRPGDGKWGMNGIPAGVIFALDLRTSRRSTWEDHQAGEQVDIRGNEIPVSADPACITDPRRARGSLVKRKWTDMQHKLMKRKPRKKRPAQLLLMGSDSGSIPFSTYSSEQSPRTGNHDAGLRTPTRAHGYPHSPGLHMESLPLPSPATQDTVRSLHDDDTDEEEIRLETDRHEKIASYASWTFPTRQSSLSGSPKNPQPRHSKGLRLSTNPVVHDAEKIEEEQREGDHAKRLFAQHARKGGLSLALRRASRAPATSIDASTGCPEVLEEHDRPKSADSDISPRDTSKGVMPFERLMTPIFKDFVAVPGRPRSKSPRTATTEYGRESFVTDNVSSLGSGMQSSFFPFFPGHATDDNTHSRRPSHATDGNPDSRRPSHGADRRSEVKKIDVKKIDKDRDDDHVDSQRLSAMFTLTPATPLQLGDARRGSVTSKDAWTDCNYFSPDATSLGSATTEVPCELPDWRHSMVVKPLRVEKAEGVDRQGEWEGKKEYGRWRRGEMMPFGMGEDWHKDGDRGKEIEECESCFGEVLKPVAFEGF